jgi:hypothetical protein
VGYWGNGNSQVYFQPGAIYTGIDSASYAAYSGQNNDYKSGRVSSNFAHLVSNEPRWSSFKTGHWAMSAGDVLSHRGNGSQNNLYYNYVILEEAAG